MTNKLIDEWDLNLLLEQYERFVEKLKQVGLEDEEIEEALKKEFEDWELIEIKHASDERKINILSKPIKLSQLSANLIGRKVRFEALLVGDVGIGKTTSIKKLIELDKNHIYIVFDCHDEYNLPEVQTLVTNLTQSCRIRMPKQISASQGLFPVYFNQILSRKYPENYVIIIEEAHRYKETKTLLKEARKFVKLIAILQEPLGDFCPIIEVVK